MQLNGVSGIFIKKNVWYSLDKPRSKQLRSPWKKVGTGLEKYTTTGRDRYQPCREMPVISRWLTWMMFNIVPRYEISFAMSKTIFLNTIQWRWTIGGWSLENSHLPTRSHFNPRQLPSSCVVRQPWIILACDTLCQSVTQCDTVWQSVTAAVSWLETICCFLFCRHLCIMYHFVPWSGFVPSPPVNPSTLSKTYRFFLVSLPFSVQPILIFSIAIIKRCWLLCVYCLFLLILPPFICQFAVFQLLLKSPPATLWFPFLRMRCLETLTLSDVGVLRLWPEQMRGSRDLICLKGDYWYMTHCPQHRIEICCNCSHPPFFLLLCQHSWVKRRHQMVARMTTAPLVLASGGDHSNATLALPTLQHPYGAAVPFNLHQSKVASTSPSTLWCLSASWQKKFLMWQTAIVLAQMLCHTALMTEPISKELHLHMSQVLLINLQPIVGPWRVANIGQVKC